jgi:uncharacterized protein (TIGR01777 family)
MSMKKQLLIAGGTGMIGSAIHKQALEKDWEVTLLSRGEGTGIIRWDPQHSTIYLSQSRSFDAIINLAGTSIAGGKWTKARKKEIQDSRLLACQTLEKYLVEGKLQTRVYLGASAVGIYGNRGDEHLDETSSIHAQDGWMSKTVQLWEEGHAKIEALGIRTIILRIGIVLSTKGGALHEILQTKSLGVLGYFGNGSQIWPWIHIDDLVRIFLEGCVNEKMRGIYLAASPHPVSNKDLILALNNHLSPRRIVMPVPVFALSLMLGEMHQMLMDSCNAFPVRLLQEGFTFHYANADEAMAALMKKNTD